MDNKPINQVLNQLEKYQETTRRLIMYNKGPVDKGSKYVRSMVE